MDDFWIHGRKSLNDAADLMEEHGSNATVVAAHRARTSRERDNIVRYCHWRQIERVIERLECDQQRGTIH